MRGVYLSYTPSSEGQRKLVPRLEGHVILPALTEYDVMIQIKACCLSAIDTKTYSDLFPNAEQIPVGYEISGVVTKVGSSVTSVAIGDKAAGILPLDTECPGCAEYCTMPEFCLVKKPGTVSHSDAAATLRGGVKAYTVLAHQTRLEAGAIVLVCSAASGDGLIMLQLCESLGIKVIATVSNVDEASILQKLHPSLLRVIDLSSTQNIVDVCLQETGGLGVNCIVDSGVSPSYAISNFLIESDALKRQLEQETVRREYEVPPDQPPIFPTKYQLISCLAARGHWVTTQPNLQLDPPESQMMLMKGASLHFLFEPVWMLSSAQQGDYLQILKSIMTKLENGILKPYIFKTIMLDQVCDEVVRLGAYGVGSVIMRTNIQR